MPIFLCYLFVTVVWSTTPLATLWSLEALSPMASIFIRLLIALLLLSVMRLAAKDSLNWHLNWKAYVAAAFGLFPSMTLIYWAAQYLPSGLMSVLFGLSPFAVASYRRLLFGEKGMASIQLMASLIALVGLLVLMGGLSRISVASLLASALVVLAVMLFSLSALLTRHYSASISPTAQLQGALMLATPCFAIVWLLVEGPSLEIRFASKGILSIIYLSTTASLFSYLGYLYLLKHLDVVSVAFIPLLTPVLAMFFGVFFNNESVHQVEIVGVALIILALAVFNYQLLSEGLKRFRPMRKSYLTSMWR